MCEWYMQLSATPLWPGSKAPALTNFYQETKFRKMQQTQNAQLSPSCYRCNPAQGECTNTFEFNTVACTRTYCYITLPQCYSGCTRTPLPPRLHVYCQISSLMVCNPTHIKSRAVFKTLGNVKVQITQCVSCHFLQNLREVNDKRTELVETVHVGTLCGKME